MRSIDRDHVPSPRDAGRRCREAADEGSNALPLTRPSATLSPLTRGEGSAGTLILGYGNTLRGDDGLGVRAAEALGVEPLHQLGPELADAVARAKVVVFIDATREGTPGELRCRRVLDADSSELTHHVTPGALVGLARQLYGGNPEAYEVTLCGERFDVAEELSPTVEAKMPELLELVRSLSGGRTSS